VRNPTMPESYYREIFIGGLKPAIKSFEKWEKVLCELCDYFPGHKCKKMGSNYLIVLVDEEEDTTKYNFCSDNHPLVDALQVFDESPKRNTYIKSNAWFGEGQEKLPEGFEVVSSEQLGGLNPFNELFKKSTSSTHDKAASNTQQEQQGNVQQLSDEMPKKLKVPKWYEPSQSVEVFKLVQI